MSVIERVSGRLYAMVIAAAVFFGGQVAAAVAAEPPAAQSTAAAPAVPALGSAADGPGLQYGFSGFATVAVGRILGGTHDPEVNQGWNCPCFISDYAQGGVYEDRGWTARPGSRVGLQGRLATEDQKYSLTAQVVARGATESVRIEWLYGTVELDSRFTLQVGRKRLPLFLFSDVQDVGYALPWIHLPPQMYGWEVVNYDGVNLLYREQAGNWTLLANAFAGGETLRDAGYWRMYNGKESVTDSRWKGIVGGELRANRDWFVIRTLYMQSDTQSRARGIDPGFSEAKRQRIYGLSLTADFGQLFGGAELLAIDRKADYGRDNAQLLWAGYRMGKWTPLLSWSNYRLHPTDPLALAEAHATTSAVLRYDLGSTSSLKVQLDAWKDRSQPGFGSMHGDARLLTVALDMVF